MTLPNDDLSLSLDEVVAMLKYRPETGEFHWVVSQGTKKAGSKAGNMHKAGYIEISIHGRKTKAHRLAWFISYGYWPAMFIDHMNNVRHDNRLVNLREASAALNA